MTYSTETNNQITPKDKKNAPRDKYLAPKDRKPYTKR